MDLVKICPPPCGTLNPASQFTCLKCQRSLVAVQPTLRTEPSPTEETNPSPGPPSKLQRCPNPECAFAENPPEEAECVLCDAPLNESRQAENQNTRDRAEPQSYRGTQREAPYAGGTRREVAFVVEFPFERVIVRERLAVGRDATFSPLAEKIQQYDKVSRRHAELLVINGQLQIIDLGSMNHVYVNGTEIANNVLVPLQPGDGLSFSSELKARISE